MAIKNTIFVEVNVINICVKFQLYPLIASEKIFDFFFRKFSLSVAMATNQIQRFGQKLCLVEDYTRNNCSEITINAIFHSSLL